MASKTVLLTDPSAKKLWAAKSAKEAVWGSVFMDKRYGFMGDSSHLIKEDREWKEHGGQLTSTLLMQITEDGTVDGAPVEGTETDYASFTHTYEVHELASPLFAAKSQLDDQRVEWDIVKNGVTFVKEWWNPALNCGPMLQMAGYTATTATDYFRPNGRAVRAGSDNGHQYTGMNSVVAPTDTASAKRIMRANAETTDQALTTESTHKMTSELLDDLIATAPQTIPPIRPAKWAGGENFFVFMHTDQYRDLIDDSKIDAIENAVLQGGLPYEQSTYATGNVRPYRGCIIVVSNWNPPGVHSSTGVGVANTRRAVFAGAGALTCGWGVNHGENRFRLHQEKFNVGGSYRCISRSIWGCSKVIYNNKDFATYVLTTYAKNRGDTGA